MLEQKPLVCPGGTVRITDSSNFPISKTTAAAHVTIKEGGMREMHWHPNADEWSIVLKGHARVTIFASNGNARTFNYQAGDVGIVPKNNAHYVENIGEGEVEMLEVFRASRFQDFSTEQWLANTPGYIVSDHLNLEGDKKKAFLEGLNKDKVPVKDGKIKRRSSFSNFEMLRVQD
jgi:oxalate decarboxylase family bicupin protein